MIEHDGCNGCKHDKKDGDEMPCSHCRGTLCPIDPFYKKAADLYEPQTLKNPYWERITALADKQRAKGMETYGQGLESNPAALVERIEHLQEELIDSLYYLEWIKDGLNETK